MQEILLINLIIAGIVLGIFAAFLVRGNENFSKKLARVRVRIDDHDRRRLPKSQQDEYEQTASADLLFIGVLVFMVLMLINLG